jgi:predicted nucleotidyltransferase
MRLTERQKVIIQGSAEKIFGKHLEVFLFGSRTNDQLKGGDIDLLIKAEALEMTARNKVLFLVDLKKHLGERKIDVVYGKHAIQNDVFFKTISNQLIRLC